MRKPSSIKLGDLMGDDDEDGLLMIEYGKVNRRPFKWYIGFNSFTCISPKQARKIASWLIRAAYYCEYKQKKVKSRDFDVGDE